MLIYLNIFIKKFLKKLDKKNGVFSQYKRMLLSEQIQLKKSEELSNLCHLAKNLYNQANYLVRHRYFFLLNPERLDFKWLKELKNKLISKSSNISNISSITKKYLEIKNNLIQKYNKTSGKQGYGGIGKFMSYKELWALMKYTWKEYGKGRNIYSS